MWILPSRSRPHNCARLFLHEFATPGVLCVDDNDPLLGEYQTLKLPAGWQLSIGPRTQLSEIYNRAWRAHPGCDWYGVLADDVVPETRDWDRQLVTAALPDGMAFGDDGINGHDRGTHFVLAGALVRDVGWLALPGLDRIYIDTVWNDIARSRRVRRYLPGVKLTHLHVSNRKAMGDAIYRKMNKDRDRAVYTAWRNG